MIAPLHFLLIASLALSLGACASAPVANGEPQGFKSEGDTALAPAPVDVDMNLSRVKEAAVQPADPQVPGAPTAPLSGNPHVHPATPGVAGAPVPEVPSAAAFAKGKTITYVVKAQDTLMKISFSVFGDLTRWREIYEQNRARIPNANQLVKGTVLKINRARYVKVERNGDPYLIHRRDTLWKISDNLYGSPRRWPSLWENNRQLIHDPNRIYAGFYLYYHPDVVVPKLTQLIPLAPPAERAPASSK